MSGCKEQHKCPPHHFVISEGVGRCKYCPAVKDFGEGKRKQDDKAQKKRSAGGRRGVNPYGRRGKPRGTIA